VGVAGTGRDKENSGERRQESHDEEGSTKGVVTEKSNNLGIRNPKKWRHDSRCK